MKKKKDTLPFNKINISMKRRLLVILVAFIILLAFLAMRVLIIQTADAEFLQEKAYDQQTRDRLFPPIRGNIYDRNFVGLAVSESVYSVSVIKAQITEPEKVASILASTLDLEYETVLAKISKKVALERIATKVDRVVAEDLRKLELDGVMIDEDVLRIYPYSTLAAQVIGFVGKDNQGIIGLEAKYDEYLKGESGKILTETDASGHNIPHGDVKRLPPTNGYHLVTSLDTTIQQYAEQSIQNAVEARNANRGLILMMNPQNGEIIAMANYPNFDLNEPFTIVDEDLEAIWKELSSEAQMEELNHMWRNFALNDTYEPGSTFKIITSAAGIEEGIITEHSRYSCSGSRMVGDRAIKCWRHPRNHGIQNFAQAIQNSCNPVFMEVAENLGVEVFYDYLRAFGFYEKTGIDLPGEAVGIFHQEAKVGPVELATMSFGQSFQISPLQLLKAVSASINGGFLVTPHVGMSIIDEKGNILKSFEYSKGKQVISTETSEEMTRLLESVVSAGTGNRTYIPGYRVGGKTATSEKLPRRQGKYISSFLTFSPADNPEVLTLVLIDEPKGAYYGGQVAGPVMKEVLDNALPYLGITPIYTPEEEKMPDVSKIIMPHLLSMPATEAKILLQSLQLDYEMIGTGEYIIHQFPLQGVLVNPTATVILTLGPDPLEAPSEADDEAEDEEEIDTADEEKREE